MLGAFREQVNKKWRDFLPPRYEGWLFGKLRPQLDSGIHAPQDGTAMQQSLSNSLADIALPDSGGRQVRLGSLWATSPAVIVFLRHYG
jgi:hypothetical protein